MVMRKSKGQKNTESSTQTNRVYVKNGITTLDLHGVKHVDVKNVVINFVWTYGVTDGFPLIIITGNSTQMTKLVVDSLIDDGATYTTNEFGKVVVTNVDYNS